MSETLYDLLVRRVEEALTALTESRDVPAKSAAIWDWLEEHFPEDARTLESSRAQYLSIAARRDDNRIHRKPGTYSYELKTGASQRTQPPAAADEEDYEEGETPARRSRQQREKRIYPVLIDWLVSQRYGAKETADTKSGGAWGNPDVTGVSIVEGYLGQRHVEIATIEAKLNHRNWKREFFEAVSHKRFAHRAYFAFAIGSDETSLESLDIAPDIREIRSYCEKFRVGALVVFVPLQRYEALCSSSLPTDLRSDEAWVTELWPAVYEPVDPAGVNNFLSTVLQLNDDRALYAFTAVPT